MGPKFIGAIRYSVVCGAIKRTTPSDGYFQNKDKKYVIKKYVNLYALFKLVYTKNSCLWIGVNVTINSRYDLHALSEYFQFNNHGINYHLNGKYRALKLKNESEIYKSKNIQSSAQ